MKYHPQNYTFRSPILYLFYKYDKDEYLQINEYIYTNNI